MSTETNDAYWRDVIDPGDRASKLAREICFRSHHNSDRVVVVPHQPGNFRGPVGFLWKHEILEAMARYSIDADGGVTQWELMEEVENDGAGGKPQFFTLLGEADAFRGLGWEIISMTADDFARSGRLPVVIDNEINIKRVNEENFHLFQAVMEGYGDALAKARLVNITGETAIMKHSVTAFCDTDDASQLVLTWGASCIGLARKDKLIDGSGIKPGMAIVGLHEKGYRCNGGTFFTNLILNKWGPDVRDVMNNQIAREFVRELTVPSASYARFITELVGWNCDDWGRGVSPEIFGIAHITGGGVWGKFKEMLPVGVGANLSLMPDPPDVLRCAQELSLGTPFELSDWQGYSTLHGGCGMLIVCTPKSVFPIITQADSHGIDASYVGKTTESQVSEVLIASRYCSGKELSSECPE